MKKIILIMLILSLVSLSGCIFGKKQATSLKSMEELHRENGVPVKTEEVKADDFSAVLKYSATLRARSEAVRYARIADVVENVHFNVGDYVQKDQTVVSFPESNQAAQYYQLRANYDLAEATYRRMERLYQEGIISKQELDDARANFEVVRANLKATDDVLRVKAPLGGYITQLNVKTTDNVNPDEPLFTVSNLDLIEAQIWASSKEIDQIKLGQKVTLEWDGKMIEGSIFHVSQIMDPSKKAFEVKALFQNKHKILTSGITADIAIETYRNNRAVVIQRKYLVNKDGKHFVYVVDEGKAVEREVVLAAERGAAVEVRSGLRPGDVLIIEGNTMVTDQAKVNVVNS